MPKAKLEQKKMCTVVPLWYLKCNISKWSITDNICIRKLTGPEGGEIEELLGFYGTIHPEFGLEINWEGMRVGEIEDSSLDEYIDLINQANIDEGYILSKPVIKALRLFKTGSVGTNLYLNREKSSKSGLTFDSGWVIDLHSHGNSYLEISKEELIEFNKFYEKFQRNSDQKFAAHIERFNKVYSNMEKEERLVDLISVLEGMLLPDTTVELRFQLSFRLAKLLGNTFDERKEIFNKARKTYDFRSKIVHGESLKNKELKDLNSLELFVEEAARRCLKLFMEDPNIFSQDSLIDRCLK